MGKWEQRMALPRPPPRGGGVSAEISGNKNIRKKLAGIRMYDPNHSELVITNPVLDAGFENIEHKKRGIAQLFCGIMEK